MRKKHSCVLGGLLVLIAVSSLFAQASIDAKLTADNATIVIPELSAKTAGHPQLLGAQTLSGFEILGKRIAATDPTLVRIGHRNGRIILWAECTQRNLDPVYNEVQNFQAHEFPRDSHKMFKDDGVEMFFVPDSSGKLYQFAFNSKGCQFDAAGGQEKYDGKWVVRAAAGKGKWWGRVDMPLRDLGYAANDDVTGTMNICRNRQIPSELSSYAPLQGRFHEPQSFATFRLGKPGSVADVTWKYEGRQISQAFFSLHNPTSTTQTVEIGLVAAGKVTSRKVTLPAGRTLNQTIRLVDWLTEAPRVRAYVKLDDGEYRLITPWKHQQVDGLTVKATLQADCDTVLYVNSKEVKLQPLNDNTQQGWVKLGDGVNTVGVDTSGHGKWKLTLSDARLGTILTSDRGWRVSTRDANIYKGYREAKWMDNKYIAPECFWPRAAELPDANDAPGQAKWLIAAPEARYLCQLWMNRTSYYPHRKGKHRFYRGLGTIGKAVTLNPGPQTLHNYEMIVDTNDALNMLNPAGKVNRGITGFAQQKLTDGYTRNIVQCDPMPINSKVNLAFRHQYEGVPFILQPAGKGTPRIRVSMRAQNGFIREVPQVIEFEVHDFPKPGRDKRMEIQVWTRDYYLAPSNWEPILKMYKAAGVSTLVIPYGGSPYAQERVAAYTKQAQKMGLRVCGYPFWPSTSGWGYHSEGKDAPVFQKRYKDTNFIKKHTKTITLLDKSSDAYAFWKERLERHVRKFQFDDIMWDFELPPLARSYDPQTLETFRKYASLGSDVILSEDTIAGNEELKRKWIEFRCWQSVKLAEEMRNIVKGVKPDTRFELYSGYYPKATDHYTVDWIGMSKVVDLGIAGYFGMWRQSVRQTAEVLNAQQKKPFLSGIAVFEKHHGCQNAGLQIAKSLAEGARGGLVFTTASGQFNTATLASISEATQIFPVIAPLLDDYQRKDELLKCNMTYTVLEGKDKYLIGLFNRSGSPRKATLNWAGPRVKGFQIFGSKRIQREAPAAVMVKQDSFAWVIVHKH